MKIGIAKKIVCEEEAGKVERYSYPMQAPFILEKSQKQQEQYRAYVIDKLEEERIDKQNGTRAE